MQFSCLLSSFWLCLIWLFVLWMLYQVVASTCPSMRVSEKLFVPLLFLGRFGQFFWLTSDCQYHHYTFFWYVSFSFPTRVLSGDLSCPPGSVLRFVGICICGNKAFMGEWASPIHFLTVFPCTTSFHLFFPVCGRVIVAGSPSYSSGRTAYVHFLCDQGKIARTLASPMFIS